MFRIISWGPRNDVKHCLFPCLLSWGHCSTRASALYSLHVMNFPYVGASNGLHVIYSLHVIYFPYVGASNGLHVIYSLHVIYFPYVGASEGLLVSKS